MKTQVDKTNALLASIRDGKPMTLRQQLRLTVLLSVPAVIAQLSSIVMQYIDAAMVGHFGAEASASIGLVSTTTWLFWGLCVAAATGFSVQVTHRIGAGDMQGARAVLRQSLTATLVFSLLLAVLGAAISGMLPGWLGGDVSIHRDASLYFFIFSLFLPALQMNFLAGGMLRCCGNMHMPSLLGVAMCILDVVFNFFLIFPSREWHVAGVSFTMPGAGLGVEGAALGTAAAEAVVAGILLRYLWMRSDELKLTGEQGSFRPRTATLKKAIHIGLPMGIEHIVICGAQIMTTVIVAPLGVFAIAANSFAITAESLCYMPGYGIADTGRAKYRCRPPEADTQFRPHHRIDGNGYYGIDGCTHVSVRAPDYRIDDTRWGNPGIGRDGLAHRGVRRADVRGFDCRLRGLCRGG